MKLQTLTGKHRALWPLIVPTFLLIIAGLFFVPILDGYWLADDFAWVHDFSQYSWRDVPKLFLGDWSRAAYNEYRPLWALSFITDLTVWGADARALHATNILLHIVASALVWYLATTIRGAPAAAALLSLAFFILAPIHDEPVSWISARGHILAPIFILGAIILLRRFEIHGSIGIYLTSIGAAIAAFTTQEAAVALPALLLLRDIVDAPRSSWRWLRRMGMLHAPFWGLLGAYLGFRILIFGRLGRDGMPSSIQQLLYRGYVSVRTLWLSPTTTPNVPSTIPGVGDKLLLFLLISVLLITPCLYLHKNELHDYIRSFIYFAIGWPIITTIVFMGANSPRHLYLASVGPAIVLGLAGAHIITKRSFIIPGSSIVVLLLVFYGFALASSVVNFELNGERSHQIKHEVDEAIEHASRNANSIVIIIPELPDNKRVFWEYFYPVALQPPFTGRIPVVEIIPSFASCDCLPYEWMLAHSTTLTRIIYGTTGPIYVVEWDSRQATFITRVFNQTELLKAGYMAPGGPLVRPRWSGGEAPLLP